MALCSDSISNSNVICGIVVVGLISNFIVDSIIPTRFEDIAPRSLSNAWKLCTGAAYRHTGQVYSAGRHLEEDDARQTKTPTLWPGLLL